MEGSDPVVEPVQSRSMGISTRDGSSGTSNQSPASNDGGGGEAAATGRGKAGTKQAGCVKNN